MQFKAVSYLVQDQTIGRCWHNLTKSYIDCKYSWILTQSTWIVSKLRHCVGMDGLSAHVWGSHWGPPSPRCFFFLRIPTVTTTFAWLSLQFHRLWWPRDEDANSERSRSQLISIVFELQIIHNWATILWIAKNEILDCDRILRFWKWPFRRLWASGCIVEAPRAWVGACPRLQTQNLSVGR